MRIELTREETKKAIAQYLTNKGICDEYAELDIKVGKLTTTVTITEKDAEPLPSEECSVCLETETPRKEDKGYEKDEPFAREDDTKKYESHNHQ